jgi:hypothetical protein
MLLYRKPAKRFWFREVAVNEDVKPSNGSPLMPVQHFEKRPVPQLSHFSVTKENTLTNVAK